MSFTPNEKVHHQPTLLRLKSLYLEHFPSLSFKKLMSRVRRSEEGLCSCLGYLGDKGAAVGKEAEFRGELKGEVGERRRGLASRSPLCSFHSSSSFSMDRRLLTLDSFCSVCWRMACSLDSCLQGETESCSGLQGNIFQSFFSWRMFLSEMTRKQLVYFLKC